MTRKSLKDDESSQKCHLEDIARETCTAMFIDRNFDIKTSPWTRYHPDFDEMPDSSTPPFVSRAQETSSPAGLQAWLSFDARLAQSQPDWTARLVDATCTEYNIKGKYAAVVMNTVVSGFPVGVIRSLLTLLEYKFVGGKWLVASYKMLPGLDYSDSGALGF